jgi:predicted Zn-dependent protease
MQRASIAACFVSLLALSLRPVKDSSWLIMTLLVTPAKSLQPMHLLKITAGSFLICLLTACSTSPTGRSQFLIVSPESAIQQSRGAYRQAVETIREEDKLSENRVLDARIRRIAGRVVTAAAGDYPRSATWEWSVVVVEEDETVNAWCMAGGRMAVYTGLFEQLKLTDAEFAQIIGHEISHALANHTAERMSRAMAIQLGLIAISAATDGSQSAGQGAELLAQMALELPNSRTAETEADRLGMRLATLAGYDPEAAVTLWQKMSELGEERPPAFLSTHPAPNDRQAQLNALIPSMRSLNPTGSKLPATNIRIVN